MQDNGRQVVTMIGEDTLCNPLGNNDPSSRGLDVLGNCLLYTSDAADE